MKRLSLSVAGSSNVTLDPEQADHYWVELTGVLTGSIIVYVPNVESMAFSFWNRTTGAYTITVKPVELSNPTGVVIPQGKAREIHHNGSDVVVSESDVSTTEIDASDFATIQAAIDACPTGGTVVIPTGTHVISGAAYAWTHEVDGPKVGLKVQKRVHLRGEGYGTILQPGANGVDVVTLYSVANNPAARTSFVGVSNLRINNPNNYSSCNGLTFDRGYRNRARDLFIGEVGGPGFVRGVRVKNSWVVNLDAPFIFGCTTGVDATEAYTPPSGENGPSHALMIGPGGEIAGNVTGVWFGVEVNQASVIGTTVEGNSSTNIRMTGSFNCSVAHTYMEPIAPGYDVMLEGNWRSITLDNVQRLHARDGWGLVLTNFRDIPGSVLDLNDTVKGVHILAPWTGNSLTTQTQNSSEMWELVERGQGMVDVPGEPKSHVFPVPDWGENLLANAEMEDSASGWTLSQMSPQTSVVPFGQRVAVGTTTTTPAAQCHAYKALDATFSNDLRGKLATLSFWIKVPDTSWECRLELRDGDRAANFIVDDSRLDNAWHVVSVRARIGDAATTIAARVNFVVGSSGGVAYAAGGTLSLGYTPLRPVLAPTLRPQVRCRERPHVKSTVTLTANDQIDPLAAPVQILAGSGGNVTLNTAQTVFSNESAWKEGMTVTLVGTSNTVTLTDGSGTSTKVRLGSVTRTLGNRDNITLIYLPFFSAWLETSYVEYP